YAGVAPPVPAERHVPMVSALRISWRRQGRAAPYQPRPDSPDNTALPVAARRFPDREGRIRREARLCAFAAARLAAARPDDAPQRLTPGQGQPDAAPRQ